MLIFPKNAAGSKKVVLMFPSVNSVVMAPERTGSLRRSNRAVMATDHTKRGIRSKDILTGRMLIVVVIKFTLLV